MKMHQNFKMNLTRILQIMNSIILGIWKKIKTFLRNPIIALPSLFVRGSRGFHRFVCAFEPWGIVLTLMGIGIALVTMLIEFEDRQSERIFRAWEFVYNMPPVGTSHRAALEYLNREFDGFVCGNLVNFFSELVTGDGRRTCLIPPKYRESLVGVEARGADLSFAEFSGANFSMAELVDSNLRSAVLIGADLRNAKLEFAELNFAKLEDANFSFAYLSLANLDHATLTGSFFIRSELSSASLKNAILTDANLIDADLTGANFNGADLSGAALTDADLTDTDLTNANLDGTFVTQSQLDSACGSKVPLNLPTGLEWRSESCPLAGFLE